MGQYRIRKQTVAQATGGLIMQVNVNLLFADDDQGTLDLLRAKTRAMGWTGDYVRSATQIINAVNINCTNSDQEYDAIIADVNYFNSADEPRLTGITAARELRKVRPDVPIIFISGYVNSILREEARRLFAEIVSKPFDLDKLFDKIDDMVNWHRLSRTDGYEGLERRIMSVNLTNHERRGTDKLLSVPIRLENAITEAKQKGTKK